MVVLGARVVVMIALLSGVAVLVGGGGGATSTGALERTMGRAKAEMTMPVVMK